MKTKSIIFILFTTVFFTFIGCKDENETPEPALTVTIKDPTAVSEKSFTANWSVNRSEISSVKIDISLGSDFTNIFKTVTVNDPSKTSQLVDGLNGATTYYHRINVTLNDGTSGTSNLKSLTTSYFTETANVTTYDGLNIAGKICYLESISTKKPAVILMGVMGLPNLWKAEEVFQNLVSMGYVCYIFDWRGQGQSDYWELPTTVESMYVYVTEHCKKDMHACYTYLKNHQKVDSTMIALMGGSLGANESLIGNNWSGVKSSVALSPSRFGLNLEVPLRNILLIAGEQDESSSMGWNYAGEATIIYEAADEPKKLVLVPGAEHGLELMAIGGINQEILEWINARFED